MKLTYLKIENLRCIESIEMRPTDFLSLIGPNNSGKSSVLRGIELFLDQLKPSPDEWRAGFEGQPIVIEAHFAQLEQWEREVPGVSGLVHRDEIRLRRRIQPPGEDAARTKPETEYECLRAQESIKGWGPDAKWSDLSEDIKALAREHGINGTEFGRKAGREKLRGIIRDQKPELVETGDQTWTTDGISIAPALKQAIPRVLFVPAVRDAEADGSFGASTTFGKIMKQTLMPALRDSEVYKKLLESVDAVRELLEGDGDGIESVRDLSRRITESMRGLMDASVSVSMTAPDTRKLIESSTYLQVDDGTRTRIGLQGHGLQRALIFALLDTIASATREDTPRPATILLFEEPELYMHPHMMRRLKSVLRDVSARDDWQVIASTHSPFLVDLAEDRRSLVIHRRAQGMAPSVTQLEADPLAGDNRKDERARLRAMLDFHPSVCEAFFAQRVVLVEGDTERAVLTLSERLLEMIGETSNLQSETTIVSCNGKWTIAPIFRILRAFGIPVRVIHDEDRNGRTDEALGASKGGDPWRANQHLREIAGEDPVVHVVEDTFEDLLTKAGEELFKSSKDKPYRAYKKAERICHENASLDDFPSLSALLRFAYTSPTGPL